MKMPAWSYSSLTAFQTCPRRYYLTRVSKQVIEPQSEAMIYGNRVHEALEYRIKNGTPLPEGLEKYEVVAKTLEAAPVKWQTETKFALTEALEPTEFFAKNVWCRGIMDIHAVKGNLAVVADYKTGKVRPELSQLKLFAAATFHKYPQVDTVQTLFLWLQNGTKFTEEVFHREQLDDIWEYFTPLISRMQVAYATDTWPPVPSGLCRKWCPVGTRLCEHCGS